jgi:hypothetical protein
MVRLEQWSYHITYINQVTLRYFIARAWGMATIILVNVYFNILGETDTVAGFKVADKGCAGVSTLQVGATGDTIPLTTYANCNEDNVTVQLLYIVLSEFLFTKLVDLAHYWIVYLLSKDRVAGKVWKPELNPGKVVSDNLMLAFVLYMILPISPIIVVLFPIISFFQFLWVYYKVKKLKSKPQGINLEPETGYMLMIIFNISMFMIVAFHCLLYIAKYPHNTFLEVS